ncbi:MAG: hypothetical protein K6B74_03665 [Ruminococcus sp.]|nr:hypothetical protein [Ruminococcus sp.]
MKKRVFSLICVLVIVFTGAFSCIASADSSAVQKYFNLYRQYLRGLGESLFDPDFFGLIGDLTDLLGEQQNAVQEQQDDSDGLKLYYACEQKYFPIDVLGYSASNDTLKDCAYFAIIENFRSESYSSRYNLGNAYCVAVPLEYVHNVSSSFDGTYYRLIASGPIVYYQYTLKLQVANDGTPITYAYSGPTAHNVSSGQFYLNNITVNPDPFYYGRRLGLNDFERARLLFTGTSSETPGTINLFLNSSRDIVSDVDGTFMIGFGILYDDGSDRMYCGEYIDFREVVSGSSWESSFDLKAFSEYAYRKRCPLENYKAFIFAYQNGFVFNMEFPLELDPPGGIFKDIEDPPDWKDYEPEPSEPPVPPVFEGDRIFNYTSSVNNYQSFNFTTINNYNVSGAGGGNTGSGDDSSSGSGDDSSSGTDDPGGDSSSGSDSGGDGSFNDWFSDAVVTINNNVNGGLDTLNENIRIIKENTENYFTAVHDYIEGYFHDWLEYIAALLKKFRDDFNNWTTAFGDYLTESFKTINRNIVIVGDNIVKAIKTQVVPDKDVVYDIASSHFPMVDQLNTVFTQHEVEQKDLIVSIPLFGSDAEPAAYFVEQSLNSDGQLRGGGEVSQASSSPINDVSGDCVTFNLTDIFAQYDLPRFRSVGSVFILAATFFSLINITLKIFGLSFK